MVLTKYFCCHRLVDVVFFFNIDLAMGLINRSLEIKNKWLLFLSFLWWVL